MGVLRFLLAFSVMWTHGGLAHGLSGDLCVTIFFVISGFYMAMVLSEKDSYNRLATFYSQRMLRLFPTYWAVLVISLLAAILVTVNQRGWSALLTEKEQQLHPILFVFWLFSHLFILGQDVFLFFGLDTIGNLKFESYLTGAENPLANFLLIPTAWSLSLEILFYLIVPLIVRRTTSLLVGLLLVSCGIRLVLAYCLSFVNDPWATRFFPSEFAFFLLGILGYRLVAKHSARLYSLLGASYLLLCALAVTCLSANRFGHVNVGLFSKAAAATFLLIAVLPWLFKITCNNSLDRRVGEYSYPLYLCHVLVFKLWGLLQWSNPWSDYLMMVAAVAFAVVLTIAVDKPVDRYRHRLLRAE